MEHEANIVRLGRLYVFMSFSKALARSENKLSLPKFELGLPIPFIAPITVHLTKCPSHCTKDGSISDKKNIAANIYTPVGSTLV